MNKQSRPVLDFTEYFKRQSGHGNGLIIKAGVRKGKTTLCSILTKQLLEKTDFIIISNVRFDNMVYENYIGRLFYITTDLQYFEIYEKVPDDTPCLLVWDDAQASEGFQSTEQYSDSAKALQKFLINIGKLETSFIYVCHRSYIPRSLTEGFDPLFIHIVRRGQLYVSSENFESAKEIREACKLKDAYYLRLPSWDKLQAHVLPILSKAPASFKFVVDHDRLQEILTRWDIGEDLKRAVREYLSLDRNESSEESELKILEALTYEKIYIALCLKKGRLIGTGEIIRKLFNPNILTEARKKLKNLGYK